jgi:hypothetical protein
LSRAGWSLAIESTYGKAAAFASVRVRVGVEANQHISMHKTNDDNDMNP